MQLEFLSSTITGQTFPGEMLSPACLCWLEGYKSIPTWYSVLEVDVLTVHMSTVQTCSPNPN